MPFQFRVIAWLPLGRLSCIAFFLLTGLAIQAQETLRYSGSVGKLPAEFTLNWLDQGRVSGSYFHPKGKNIVYQLNGLNPADGVLNLTESTDGNVTSSITLAKSVNNGKIVWSGTMRNTDGRKLPVSFSRSAPQVTPSAPMTTQVEEHPQSTRAITMPPGTIQPVQQGTPQVFPTNSSPALGQGAKAEPLVNLALTGERIALVIGNSAYPGDARLDNPVRDSELVAQSLEQTGFRVIRCSDQSKAEMAASLKMFAQLLTEKSTALFYYAGHGIQWQNANYLLPVDMPEGVTGEKMVESALPMAEVARMMGDRKTVSNILILDCCRNTPFLGATPQAKRGLAELKAPRETFICYATGLDEVAFDGEGANSPFSASLAVEMLKPNVKIDEVFKNVAAEVGKATANKQLPWRQSNGVRDFYFIKTKDADNRFKAKKAVWTQGELGFTLENLVVKSGGTAAASIRVRNQSKKTVWKLALDANCGNGYQPTVYYGGKLETAVGDSLHCLGARGIFTKVYLVGIWDSARLMGEQAGGYDPALLQNWFGQMNSLDPGGETLVTLIYQSERGAEGPAPDLTGRMTVRGQFYGAPEAGGKVGKVVKFTPFFEEVLANLDKGGGGKAN